MYYSDGSHNDAKILSDMFNKNNGIDNFVQPGDVFVLDRGFRDIIGVLEGKGIKMKICLNY